LQERRAIHVVGAAMLDGTRCLAAQRGPGMSLPGKWEFPGGKIERGEAPTAALARELGEELGIRAEIGDWLGRGESVGVGGYILLDVYVASTAVREFRLREHSQVRWVDMTALDELDWAQADIPLLPAVRARLRGTTNKERVSGRINVVSVDWSKELRKRSVYTAIPARGWGIQREEPPTRGWSLGEILSVAHRLHNENGLPVLVGIDAVLGLPAAFARKAALRGFLEGLRWLELHNGLSTESLTSDTWRADRPFFRVPHGRGARTAFEEAAGGRSALLRQVERRTGANSVFILSGIPGTVGSGSRSLWVELARRLADREPDFRIWPFEGHLFDLTSQGTVTLAEIYPRSAYAIALSDDLPASALSIAKTKPEARLAALKKLRNSQWLSEKAIAVRDFEAAESGEDDFDALITVVAMVRLIEAGEPLSCELVDPVVEGGILPTGMLDLPRSARRVRV